MAQPWPEFSLLDRPEVLLFVFHPRKDIPNKPMAGNAKTYLIPVDQSISISCCFYAGDESYANILYFHGNGEIASDYEDIGVIYNELGLNLFVADYRGYGRSGGTPTLSNMVKDSRPIFEGFQKTLKDEGYSGNLFVMGRSLGSASAIEVACQYQSRLKGLIIESGFANAFNLFEYLGMPAKAFGISKTGTPTGIELMQKISIPTLIIHGEYDHIVPPEEGKTLYANSGAENKRLLIIPGVDHNTVFFGGMEQYTSALKAFISAYS